MPGKLNGTRIVLGAVVAIFIAVGSGLSGWFVSNGQAMHSHEMTLGHSGTLQGLATLREQVTDIKDDQEYMQGQINKLITNTALIIQKLESTE